MTLAILIVLLIPAVAVAVYAFIRAWPRVRAQSDRMRREGGLSQGADFDAFLERKMEQLPVTPQRAPKGREPSSSDE
jgi:hypothetical protein